MRSSRELDHACCQVGNAHGLTHVEDENLAAMALRASLQYQLAGFRNQHEVANDIGVCHRYRSSVLDLLLEQGNDAAVRSQHIAEACRDKLRRVLRLAVRLDGTVQALHVDFADALRAAHDVRGVHRLVGRYHDELLHAVLHTHVCDDLRAVDVVQHRLRGVVFHHGHVLVGSGVEHIVELILAKQRVHARLAADARDDDPRVHVGELVLHHQADVVLRCLCLVDENHLCRLIDGNLSHHLRTDATCRARNEDALARQLTAYRLHIHLDLVAGQQVFHADLLQLDVIHVACPLLGALHHVDAQSGIDQSVLQMLVVAEVLAAQWRYQHGLDALLLDDSLQLFIVHAVNLFTHQLTVAVVRVVRDEALQHEADRVL